MDVTKVEYESNVIDLVNSLKSLPTETLKSLNLYQNLNDKISMKVHFTEGRGKNAHIHTQNYDMLFLEPLIKYSNKEFLNYALTQWTEKYPLKLQNFSAFLNTLFETEDVEKIDIGLNYVKTLKEKHGRDLTYHIGNIVGRDSYALGLHTFLHGNKKSLKLNTFKPIWDKYLKLNQEILNFSKIIALPGIIHTTLSQEQNAITSYIINDLNQKDVEIQPALALMAFDNKNLDIFKNIVDIHSKKKSSKKHQLKDLNDVLDWEEERMYRYNSYASSENSYEAVYESFLTLSLNNNNLNKDYIEMMNYLESKKLVLFDQVSVDIVLMSKIFLANQNKDTSKIEEDVEKAFKHFKKQGGIDSYIKLLENCEDYETTQMLINPLLQNESYTKEFKKDLGNLANKKISDYLKYDGNMDGAEKNVLLSLVPFVENRESVFNSVKKTPTREKLYLELELDSKNIKAGKKLKL